MDNYTTRTDFNLMLALRLGLMSRQLHCNVITTRMIMQLEQTLILWLALRLGLMSRQLQCNVITTRIIMQLEQTLI